jgi:hypothetical protein
VVLTGTPPLLVPPETASKPRRTPADRSSHGADVWTPGGRNHRWPPDRGGREHHHPCLSLLAAPPPCHGVASTPSPSRDKTADESARLGRQRTQSMPRPIGRRSRAAPCAHLMERKRERLERQPNWSAESRTDGAASAMNTASENLKASPLTRRRSTRPRKNSCRGRIQSRGIWQR